MKRRTIFTTILVVSLVLILFLPCCLIAWIGWLLFEAGFNFSYDSPHPYEKYATLTPDIREQVVRETLGMDTIAIEGYALRLTADQLSYSLTEDLPNGQAFCDGYAIRCSDICNFAYEINHIPYKAFPVNGHFQWYYLDLNKPLNACIGWLCRHNFRTHTVTFINRGKPTDTDYEGYDPAQSDVLYTKLDPCIYDLFDKDCTFRGTYIWYNHTHDFLSE